MMTGLAFLFSGGLIFGKLFKLVRLPALLGMLAAGIVLGPRCLNFLNDSHLSAAPAFRLLALIIILMRAGLSIRLGELRAIGRPVALMAFLPAVFEITGVTILMPLFFTVSHAEAFLTGSVLAAVSPAVVVPEMLHLMEAPHGKTHPVPRLIIAGASLDDVFVITVFSFALSLQTGGVLSAAAFAKIPVSVLTGGFAGLLCGAFWGIVFGRFQVCGTIEMLILFITSLFMIELEQRMPFSGLLAVMCMGIGLVTFHEALAIRLTPKYTRLWIVAEIALFVLIGAEINLSYLWYAGLNILPVLFGALLFRMAGVGVALIKTRLSLKERLFCMIAYFPKATVQAALGGIPLSLGLSCGQLVLAFAALSILLTAPLGVALMRLTSMKLLTEVKAPGILICKSKHTNSKAGEHDE